MKQRHSELLSEALMGLSLGIMLMAVIGLLLSLGGGCAGIRAALGYVDCPVHGDSVPPVSEATLRASWQQTFGMLPSPACDPHWTWNVVSTDDMYRLCMSRTYAGCTVYPSGCPTTFTTAGYAGDTLLAAHEYAHWALLCSRGDSDYDHHNAAVWMPTGWISRYLQ